MRRIAAAALGAAAVCALTLQARVSRAAPRCSDDVCLELALPPHVSEVRRGSTLECLVILPAQEKVPVTVAVVLRTRNKCFCKSETLQPGNTWKRSILSLASLPEGTYELGVARAPAHGEALSECSPPSATRFIARKVRIAP